MEAIVNIRDKFEIAILIIEHDMKLVMGICEGIAVLNYGRIIAKGTASDIQNNRSHRSVSGAFAHRLPSDSEEAQIMNMRK